MTGPISWHDTKDQIAFQVQGIIKSVDNIWVGLMQKLSSDRKPNEAHDVIF